MLCTPSLIGPAGVKVQLPAPSATTVPSVPSTSLMMVTVLPGSAPLPLKVGVVSLVMSSTLDTPVSEAGSRSGAPGAPGAAVSTV